MLLEQRTEFCENTEHQTYNLEGDRIEIDDQTLLTAIERLRTGRAVGPRSISAELVKYGTPKLHKIVKNLFEKCLNVRSYTFRVEN